MTKLELMELATGCAKNTSEQNRDLLYSLLEKAFSYPDQAQQQAGLIAAIAEYSNMCSALTAATLISELGLVHFSDD